MYRDKLQLSTSWIAFGLSYNSLCWTWISTCTDQPLWQNPAKYFLGPAWQKQQERHSRPTYFRSCHFRAKKRKKNMPIWMAKATQQPQCKKRIKKGSNSIKAKSTGNHERQLKPLARCTDQPPWKNTAKYFLDPAWQKTTEKTFTANISFQILSFQSEILEKLKPFLL